MRRVKEQSFIKRQFDQSIQQTVHVQLIDSFGAFKSTGWHKRRQNKAPGEGVFFHLKSARNGENTVNERQPNGLINAIIHRISHRGHGVNGLRQFLPSPQSIRVAQRGQISTDQHDIAFRPENILKTCVIQCNGIVGWKQSTERVLQAKVRDLLRHEYRSRCKQNQPQQTLAN